MSGVPAALICVRACSESCSTAVRNPWRVFLACAAFVAVVLLSALERVTTSRSSGEIAEHTALTYLSGLTLEEDPLEPEPPHPTATKRAIPSVIAQRRLAGCTNPSLASHRSLCSRRRVRITTQKEGQAIPAAAAIDVEAAAGSGDPNTAEPVTSRFAPASTHGRAVFSCTPPSTSS